jgi:hypothetical protein
VSGDGARGEKNASHRLVCSSRVSISSGSVGRSVGRSLKLAGECTAGQTRAGHRPGDRHTFAANWRSDISTGFSKKLVLPNASARPRLFPTLPRARDQRQNALRNPHPRSRRSASDRDALATGVARALAHPRASTPRRHGRGIGFKPASPARAKSRRARATPRDAPRHVSERADAPLLVEPRASRGSCSRRGPSRVSVLADPSPRWGPPRAAFVFFFPGRESGGIRTGGRQLCNAFLSARGYLATSPRRSCPRARTVCFGGYSRARTPQDLNRPRGASPALESPAPPDPRPSGRDANAESVRVGARLSRRRFRLARAVRRISRPAQRGAARACPARADARKRRAAPHTDSTPLQRARASVPVAPARVSQRPPRARARFFRALPRAARSNSALMASPPPHGIRALYSSVRPRIARRRSSPRATLTHSPLPRPSAGSRARRRPGEIPDPRGREHSWRRVAHTPSPAPPRARRPWTKSRTTPRTRSR